MFLIELAIEHSAEFAVHCGILIYEGEAVFKGVEKTVLGYAQQDRLRKLGAAWGANLLLRLGLQPHGCDSSGQVPCIHCHWVACLPQQACANGCGGDKMEWGRDVLQLDLDVRSGPLHGVDRCETGLCVRV